MALFNASWLFLSMPPLAGFRIAAIDELHRQLRFAPAGARRRQMEAAERLAAEIGPHQLYPQDFVVFRITGFRSDRTEPGPALVGEALVGDLATFIGRLSYSLDLDAQTQQRAPVELDEAARRLNLSTKTLQRYRRRGLVCHYLVFPDGVKRLACFEDALQRFVEQHGGRVGRASGFSRVSDEVVQRMISDARDAHIKRGLSLNATARQLARRYGRSHETLRGILKRHDRESPEPIFGALGSLAAHEARVICRAARMGMSPSAIAHRTGRPPPTIHRAINVGRRQQLAALELSWVPLEVLTDPGAVAALLAQDALSRGLIPLEVRLDALSVIEPARSAADSAPQEAEPALIGGYNLLKRRASQRLETLPAYPPSTALDAIETDLRWATLIKRRLVELGLPAALAATEQFLGRPLREQPREEIIAHVHRAIDITDRSIELINPDRGQQASHLCAYAMSKTLAAGAAAPPAGRAATRHRPGSVELDQPFARLCPWQPALDLRPDLRVLVGRLQEPQRQLVMDRYGLGGSRPRRLDELAVQTRRTPTAVARLIAGAERRLREEATKQRSDAS